MPDFSALEEGSAMTKHDLSSPLVIVIHFTLLLALSGTARAQSVYVGLSGGVLWIDDGGVADAEEEFTVEPQSILGAELGFVLSPHWEMAATAGLALRDENTIDVLLLYGTINYVFLSQSKARLFLSGGAGAIELDTGGFLSNIPENRDLLINFGGGARWSISDWFALQGTFRDHVHFCQALDKNIEVSYCPLDDEILHHVEASGAIVFLF